MIKVFGHKAPDTDSTGSPIVWAWYLTEVKGTPATPVLLGEPNTEAAFVLKYWDLPKPGIIADVAAGDEVVIVDTNNPAELPPSINEARIEAIIDHQRSRETLPVRAVLPISSAEYPVPARRPAFSVLDGSKLATRFGVRLPDWRDALAAVQRELDSEPL